jgi:hypothetical protein
MKGDDGSPDQGDDVAPVIERVSPDVANSQAESDGVSAMANIEIC